MIWLVKTREKAITDGAKNLYIYLKDCMSLPQNELIKLFYQIYKVPINFLEILQTQPFEDKNILNENFRIRKINKLPHQIYRQVNFIKRKI